VRADESLKDSTLCSCWHPGGFVRSFETKNQNGAQRFGGIHWDILSGRVEPGKKRFVYTHCGSSGMWSAADDFRRSKCALSSELGDPGDIKPVSALLVETTCPNRITVSLYEKEVI